MITVGDRVRYSRTFCRSIGAFAGEIPHGKGTVTEIKKLGSTNIATIKWDAGFDLPERVNTANLTVIGKLEPA